MLRWITHNQSIHHLFYMASYRRLDACCWSYIRCRLTTCCWRAESSHLGLSSVPRRKPGISSYVVAKHTACSSRLLTIPPEAGMKGMFRKITLVPLCSMMGGKIGVDLTGLPKKTVDGGSAWFRISAMTQSIRSRGHPLHFLMVQGQVSVVAIGGLSNAHSRSPVALDTMADPFHITY
jgi:hypothetical protein